MFILDTDAITHDQNAHSLLSAKVKNTPKDWLFTTSVTVEEQLKGRLAYLKAFQTDPRKSAHGHAALVQTVFYFEKWNILIFSGEAYVIFHQLQKQRIRIGSQDLRIAAIALFHDFTVITSNLRDFVRVPNLKIADWTSAIP
ncbi:MAG: type II toxin-antitoxin system VapC family toxin [Deltaproteobacteria bacterium]|nr:type II toxin-antitoxin system VapC family toxin [Deltaproteobacteria bacterium]